MGDLIHIMVCPRCDGNGMVERGNMYDSRVYRSVERCPKCKGRGRIGVRHEEIQKAIQKITEDYIKGK